VIRLTPDATSGYGRTRSCHQSRACGTSGSKLGIDATKKIPGEGFKRSWPPLIKMDAAVKAKVERLFGS
jgi:4-hydroxy-3-polyprenylbenzoate decarboxylase